MNLSQIVPGSVKEDGDTIDIDFTPANYTPTVVEGISDATTDLTAHLNGIDTALANVEVEPPQILQQHNLQLI